MTLNDLWILYVNVSSGTGSPLLSQRSIKRLCVVCVVCVASSFVSSRCCNFYRTTLC